MIMRLSKIKISKEFKMHYPKPEKLLYKIAYHIKHHKYEQPIVLDKDNVLIDGYTSYLIAKELEKKIVRVKKVR